MNREVSAALLMYLLFVLVEGAGIAVGSLILVLGGFLGATMSMGAAFFAYEEQP